MVEKLEWYAVCTLLGIALIGVIIAGIAMAIIGIAALTTLTIGNAVTLLVIIAVVLFIGFHAGRFVIGDY